MSIDDKDKKIFLPSGDQIQRTAENVTERGKERVKEDQNYIPIIIKRNDETMRHPDDILESAIHEGLEQYQRTKLSLFLSAVAAGLILGFVAMSVAIVTKASASFEPITQRLLIALFYPLGFVVCILSRTQLFTEHTARAVYPFLERKVEFMAMIRVWAIVLTGNFVGTFICSFLITQADTVINARPGYYEIAHHLTAFSGVDVFMSAILAGWLMAQGGWLILSSPSTSSQIICVFIVTFIIGVGGLHHSIAGSAEIFSAHFLNPKLEFWPSIRFLLYAICGNLVGGSFFVGILNYGHIKKT